MERMIRFPAVLLLLIAGGALQASWDVGREVNAALAERTAGKLQIVFEFRSRFESRGGQSFGAEPDLSADFTHVRAGLRFKPLSWLRMTAVARDTRAPLYGANAPDSARDPLDLHEAYFEIRADEKLGFGAVLGRQSANYGDTRLIGSPQWAYIARTYDGGRVFWRGSRFRLEALLLSPVKITNEGWNKPVMGDRIEGVYNTVSLPGKAGADLYALRHHQNRPGGYTGPGRYVTNSFGVRLFGPIARGFRYSGEAVEQTGHIGDLPHRARAWSLQFGHDSTFWDKPLELMAEYKYASGGAREGRSGTFDQISPAAHDKLGHIDVIGWRNIRNIRSTATWSPMEGLAITAMYDNSWLADARDALYNAQGRPVARSADGTAGTHIGHEADLYFTYKRSGLTIGAGYGHLFAGEFIRRATPGVSPHLAYIFQSYSF